MTFRRQIAQSVGWSTLASLLSQGFRFIGSIILARLLLPDEFGLIAIALTITNLLWTFGEFGLWQALMRWDGEVEVAANVTFMLNLITAILFTIVVYAAAPFISVAFFENVALIPILRALSFTLILNAIERVPACLMDRAFDFKQRTKIEAISQIIYLLVTVVLAYGGYGILALVCGIFAQTIIRVGLTFFAASFRPSLKFDKGVAKSLLLFGQHLVYTAVLVSFSRNIDQLLVATFVGMAEVGFYTVSLAFGRIFMELPKQAISRVMLPSYSALQNDLGKLGSLYLKSVRVSCLFIFVVAAGLIPTAHIIIPVLYGENWLPMVAYIYIWMVRLIIMGTYFLAGHILVVKARQSTLPWINAAQIGLTVIAALWLGQLWGGIGVAIANTLAVFVSALVHQVITLQTLNISHSRYLRTLLKPVLLALAIGLIVTATVVVVPVSYLGLLIVSIVGAISAGALTLGLFGRELQADLAQMGLPINAISLSKFRPNRFE